MDSVLCETITCEPNQKKEEDDDEEGREKRRITEKNCIIQHLYRILSLYLRSYFRSIFSFRKKSTEKMKKKKQQQ